MNVGKNKEKKVNIIDKFLKMANPQIVILVTGLRNWFKIMIHSLRNWSFWF